MSKPVPCGCGFIHAPGDCRLDQDLDAECERWRARVKELVCTAHLTKGDLGDDCVLCACERLEKENAELRKFVKRVELGAAATR